MHRKQPLAAAQSHFRVVLSAGKNKGPRWRLGRRRWRGGERRCWRRWGGGVVVVVLAKHAKTALAHVPLYVMATAQIDLRRSTVSDIPVLWSRLSSPPPPTGPRLEAARLQAVRELATTFREACAATLGGRKWFAHFENWLWAARGDDVGPAPVLPATPAAAASAELRDKLVRAGLEAAAAEQACRRIAARSAELAGRTAEAARVSSSSLGGGVSVRSGSAGGPLLLTWGDVEVECSSAHLDKLRKLFRERAAAELARAQKKRPKPERSAPAAAAAAAAAAAGGEDGEAAEAAAFCAVARVLALQGGEPKAGGNQAACPAALFDALRSDFGVAAGFNWPQPCLTTPPPSASLDSPKAEAAPAHPKAPPEHL